MRAQTLAHLADGSVLRQLVGPCARRLVHVSAPSALAQRVGGAKVAASPRRARRGSATCGRCRPPRRSVSAACVGGRMSSSPRTATTSFSRRSSAACPSTRRRSSTMKGAYSSGDGVAATSACASPRVGLVFEPKPGGAAPLCLPASEASRDDHRVASRKSGREAIL